MLSGIHGFAKNKLDVEEVFQIVDTCAREYGKLSFELFNKDTMKTRRIRSHDRARELVSLGAPSTVTARSVENEVNSVEVVLRGDPTCHLPYDVHLIRETSEAEIASLGRFFDSIVLLSKCDYAFGIFGDSCMKITEELRFIPMSYWSPTSLNENKEHDEYLFTLQHMRPDIGRRIPQMYPINYFSHPILRDVEGTLRAFIDEDDWDRTELDGITRVWFKDIFNRAKFKSIQEKIRKGMWGASRGQLA
jgi:hypothetical protein